MVFDIGRHSINNIMIYCSTVPLYPVSFQKCYRRSPYVIDEYEKVSRDSSKLLWQTPFSFSVFTLFSCRFRVVD